MNRISRTQSPDPLTLADLDDLVVRAKQAGFAPTSMVKSSTSQDGIARQAYEIAVLDQNDEQHFWGSHDE